MADASPAAETDNKAALASRLIDRSLAHAEAHKELLSSSWTYWSTHFSIKSCVAASAGTLAFAKEYALIVAAAALVAIVVFEVARYMQRNRTMNRTAGASTA